MNESDVKPSRNEAENPVPNSFGTIILGALGILGAFAWALCCLLIVLYSLSGGGDLTGTTLLTVIVATVIGVAPMVLLVRASRSRRR